MDKLISFSTITDCSYWQTHKRDGRSSNIESMLQLNVSKTRYVFSRND